LCWARLSIKHGRGGGAEGRLAATPGLCLALAFLYPISDRRGLWLEREPYIEFWQRAAQRNEVGDGADG